MSHCSFDYNADYSALWGFIILKSHSTYSWISLTSRLNKVFIRSRSLPGITERAFETEGAISRATLYLLIASSALIPGLVLRIN